MTPLARCAKHTKRDCRAHGTAAAAAAAARGASSQPTSATHCGYIVVVEPPDPYMPRHLYQVRVRDPPARRARTDHRLFERVVQARCIPSHRITSHESAFTLDHRRFERVVRAPRRHTSCA